MSKSSLVLLVIGVLVAAGCATYWLWIPKTDTTQREATVSTPSIEAQFVEVPLISSAYRREVFPEHNLAISLHIPRVRLISSPTLAQEANTVIDTFINEIVTNVTQAIATASRTQDKTSTNFVLDWMPLLVAPEMISIRFDYATSSPSAERPEQQTRVLNYHLARRVVLTTTDLFSSSTRALTYLSSYARKTLPELLAHEMVDANNHRELLWGTEPVITNFREIGMTPDGLLIVFNPDQVATYARGTITLPVPLEHAGALLTTEVREAIRKSTENFREALPLE